MYTTEFFAANAEVGLRSARIVLPWVLERTGARTVVDVGCGAGGWAAGAKELGCEVHAVDGYATDGLVDVETVRLDRGYDCTGYDLAICLEVGEHLPPESAPPLVAGLCKADRVLFSAAHPGQGGVGHVNEQWSTWWELHFLEHGYHGSCDVRWQFWHERDVADFYRENMILFGGEPTDGVVDVIHPQRLGLW